MVDSRREYVLESRRCGLVDKLAWARRERRVMVGVG